MATPNDRQRQEVYTAERAVDWSVFGADENLEELEAVWAYVDKFMQRKSFERRYIQTHTRFNRTRYGWKSKPIREYRYSNWGYKQQPYIVGNSNGRLHGIEIKPTSKGGWANDSTIALNKWARQKYVILHELAHVIDWNENGETGKIYHQGHGWQFCAIYLQLIFMAFGYEAKKALREEFKKHGVKYTKPRSMRSARHELELKDWWVI